MTSLTLITGAAGFVGGHLIERLQGERPLRCLIREGEHLEAADGREVVVGDIGDPERLGDVMEGVDCAFYLVHSMEAGGDEDFAARDRGLAENFAAAAADAGIRRLVYLGGIEGQGGSSEHLDSRHEVEDILAGFGGEFVALRAAMILGAGSASFSALAQIVDRLPVLALPAWRDRLCQPVGLSDAIAALAASTDVTPGRYDIGGPDRITFAAMTETIAELQGHRRPTIGLPFSNPQLEGAAAALVTDQDRELLTPLMAGVDADPIVEDNALEPVFSIEPTPFVDAAREALAA
jgi:uncharacterized protein YbjT (DUF2867 family)